MRKHYANNEEILPVLIGSSKPNSSTADYYISHIYSIRYALSMDRFTRLDYSEILFLTNLEVMLQNFGNYLRLLQICIKNAVDEKKTIFWWEGDSTE